MESGKVVEKGIMVLTYNPRTVVYKFAQKLLTRKRPISVFAHQSDLRKCVNSDGIKADAYTIVSVCNYLKMRDQPIASKTPSVVRFLCPTAQKSAGTTLSLVE